MRIDSTFILYLSDNRIVSKFGDTTVFDESGKFGIDMNTLKVLCHGQRTETLSERYKNLVAVVSPFGNGNFSVMPKLIVERCLKSFVRASLNTYHRGLLNPHFKAVVCVSESYSNEDLLMIRQILRKEGARNVRFTTANIDELGELNTIDLGDKEIKISHNNSKRVISVLLIVMSFVFLIYGEWQLYLCSLIFAFECIAVLCMHGKMVPLKRYCRNSGLKNQYSARCYLTTISVMLVLLVILFVLKAAFGISFVARGSIMAIPLSIFIGQLVVYFSLSERVENLELKRSREELQV